ncbi:MAG: 4Fe-4S binding protein [Clostridia bacterium]|nr:4Fe-4S binding protein [Clostridia bacterium]
MADKKKKLKYKKITEVIIRVIFFIAMPAAFASGFVGVKLIFNAVGQGKPIDPDKLLVLIGLLAFTIVFGRFFCGFVCAFGSLGDFIYFLSGLIQKKIFKRKKQITIPQKASVLLQKLKYVILALIALLCFCGVYSKLTGWNPWDVFSRIMVFKAPADGYILGIIILVLIIIGMAFKKRFFCQFLCPMGALFALMPVLPFTALHRDESSCIKGCKACRMNCPVDIKLGEDILRDGECIACEKCMGVCPKSNISRPEQKLVRNDIIILVIKSVLFFVMGCLLGLCRFF